MIRVIIIRTVRKQHVRLKFPDESDKPLTRRNIRFKTAIGNIQNVVLDTRHGGHLPRLFVSTLSQRTAADFMMSRLSIGGGDEFHNVTTRPALGGKTSCTKFAVIRVSPYYKKA
jgi:hypothetical protein